MKGKSSLLKGLRIILSPTSDFLSTVFTALVLSNSLRQFAYSLGLSYNFSAKSKLVQKE
jgi:hypothetical protein